MSVTGPGKAGGNLEKEERKSSSGVSTGPRESRDEERAHAQHSRQAKQPARIGRIDRGSALGSEAWLIFEDDKSLQMLFITLK